MSASTFSVDEVSQFLTDLLGVQVKASEANTSDFETIGALATYTNGEGEAVGYLACDIACAATLGAALTQVPMGAVEDAVAAGELPENLQENAGEVLNISVNLLPNHASSRLVLHGVEYGDDAEAKLEELVPSAIAVNLNVQRYGDSKMLIISKS